MMSKSKMLVTVAVAVVSLILCVTALVIGSIRGTADARISGGSPVISDRGVMAWLDAFTSRDFALCDTLVANQDIRLYSPMVITQSRDSRYYESILDAVVNCISNISLVYCEDGLYKFDVTLIRYVTFEDIEIGDVEILRDSFVEGKVSEGDFVSTLQDIYYELFVKSCLELSDEEVVVTAEFRETNQDGVVTVLGTVDFVNLVLQESGLANSLSVYETSVKAKVDSILQ